MSMPSDTEFGPLFEGRFTDGKTASSEDVQVRLTCRGVEIHRTGIAGPLIWPYGALHVAEPLSSHSIDALITYEFMAGATLFVPEGTFARRMAIEAPHLTASAQRWRHAVPWIWTASAVLLISGLVWLADFQPSRAIARMLPDSAREILGRKTVQSMSEGRRTCEASPGTAALDELVKRLSAASGSDRSFKVIVVDWSLLNAFAAPGEQIVLTHGIISKADSPDEIAGVLAHEMGHGIEMHPESGLVRAIGMTAAIDLMLGGSGGTLANFGALLAQLSYGRDAEREADKHAVRILREAKISSKGFARFFKRMQEIENELPIGKSITEINILRTHPLTEERRLAVERVPDYPSSPALSAERWKALKDICRPPPATPAEPPKDI
jgi:Zn-dependent protease with chaperone function